MSESAPASANSRLADVRPVGSMHQCPVCCQPKTNFLCSKQTYVIHTCPDCGCDYVCNPPSQEELKAYYSRGNWFEGGEEGGYRNYDEQTSDSLPFVRELLGRFSDKQGSLLDVGCGYGSHLQIAAELGWRCFGVEISEHARAVATERLFDAATIVATIDDLIPHPFDVILMLDVIEHVSDPFSLFYPLFASGAIQPHTVVIVSTPNGGSVAATADPAHWAYRHPPSHLTYFTSKTLETFFQALRFTRIDIRGLHPTKSAPIESLDLQDYDGLFLEAAGSDFQVFMRRDMFLPPGRRSPSMNISRDMNWLVDWRQVGRCLILVAELGMDRRCLPPALPVPWGLTLTPLRWNGLAAAIDNQICLSSRMPTSWRALRTNHMT